MKIMSADLGKARTGVAISDESESFAFPNCVITEYNEEKLVLRLADKAKELGAGLIVVGHPKNMDGSEGARADRCRDFARRLSAIAGIPVAMTDERLTTVAASRYLNETDTRGGKRKNIIDSLSAEIILQNTLDRLKNMN